MCKFPEGECIQRTERGCMCLDDKKGGWKTVKVDKVGEELTTWSGYLRPCRSHQ